jgi:hypothetical protein
MRDYSKTKQIALESVGLLMLSRIFYYLWSHIAHRPAPFIRFGSDCFVEVEGEAEVDDEGLEVGQVDEYILGFEVSMDDVCPVDVSNSL